MMGRVPGATDVIHADTLSASSNKINRAKLIRHPTTEMQSGQRATSVVGVSAVSILRHGLKRFWINRNRRWAQLVAQIRTIRGRNPGVPSGSKGGCSRPARALSHLLASLFGGYAMHASRTHSTVIRVYDAAGNVIETHTHKGEFKEW